MFRIKDFFTSNSQKSDLDRDLNEAWLTFYFIGQESKDTREILNEIEKKVKKEINIKLDFKFILQNSRNYMKEITDILCSEKQCDAFFYSRFFPDGLKTLVDRGLIKDLTDIFPRYAPNCYQKYTKEDMLDASVQNSIYAIPYYILASYRRCAVVREDILQKYRISEITSYDDYEKYLDIIKRHESHMVPMMFWEPSIYLFAEAYGYVVLDYRLGIVYKWDDPEMKVKIWEETPGFKKGIETIKRWYENGYFAKVPFGNKIDISSITSGKWGSFIAASGSEICYNSFRERILTGSINHFFYIRKSVVKGIH